MLKKLLARIKTRMFWLIACRDLLIVFFIISIFNLYQTREIPDYPPILQTQLISGASVNVSEMTKKAPVLIYFWGSWCPICTITSSTITDLAIHYQVISIALSSGTKQQILGYLNKNNFKFPVINDPNGEISQEWGVSATPTIIILDREGKISSTTVGISSSWGLKFRLWLAS